MKPILPALDPAQVPEENRSNYPDPFRARVAGRFRRRLGNAGGLSKFGVNLVRLEPGAQSALRHWHTRQDEFVFVVYGELLLISNAGRQPLTAGMAAAFPAGKSDGHCLRNEGSEAATYLEVGDRSTGDEVTYPDDDLAVTMVDGQWRMADKSGRPY